MTTETKKYSDENSGILGRNDYKTTEKHPDKKGRAKVGGLWYWVSAWTRTGANGEFQSLSFTLMTQEEADKAQAKSNERNAPQQAPQGQTQHQAEPRTQQPAQQQAQQNPPAQHPDGSPYPDNQPPMDFDDDIPF